VSHRQHKPFDQVCARSHGCPTIRGSWTGRRAGEEQQAEDDRTEILRIIGAAKPGSEVAERGSAAIDAGPAAMRAFLIIRM
jgi:hypothetical protein